MYLTGTIDGFSSRLHELPQMNGGATGQELLDSASESLELFLIEGRGYINAGLVTPQMSGQWEQEVRKQRCQLSGDGAQMLRQQL